MGINTSSRDWDPAKASFKEAHKNATGVFHNAMLHIEKRIIACKIRMVASMVLHIDNVDLAVRDCLLYLSQLHELGSVRSAFEVNETRGIPSKYYKDERFKLVDEVNRINQCLFYFIRNYTDYKRTFQNIVKWPIIQLKSREYVFYGAEQLLQKPDRGLRRPRFDYEPSIYQSQSSERFRKLCQSFDEECDAQFHLSKPRLSDHLQFLSPLPSEEEFFQQSQSSYKECDAKSQSPEGFFGRLRAGLTKMFVKDKFSDPRTERRRSNDQFQSFKRRPNNACQQPQLSDKRFYEDPQLSAKDNFDPMPGRRRIQLQSSEPRFYQNPQLSLDEECDDEDPQLPAKDYGINEFMSSVKCQSFDQPQYLQNLNDYEEFDEFDRATKTLVRVRRRKR